MALILPNVVIVLYYFSLLLLNLLDIICYFWLSLPSPSFPNLYLKISFSGNLEVLKFSTISPSASTMTVPAGRYNTPCPSFLF